MESFVRTWPTQYVAPTSRADVSVSVETPAFIHAFGLPVFLPSTVMRIGEIVPLFPSAFVERTMICTSCSVSIPDWSTIFRSPPVVKTAPGTRFVPEISLTVSKPMVLLLPSSTAVRVIVAVGAFLMVTVGSSAQLICSAPAYIPR